MRNNYVHQLLITDLTETTFDSLIIITAVSRTLI